MALAPFFYISGFLQKASLSPPLGPDDMIFFFITLFRYSINLLYSSHCLSFPFLKRCRIEREKKRKKEKKKKLSTIPSLSTCRTVVVSISRVQDVRHVVFRRNYVSISDILTLTGGRFYPKYCPRANAYYDNVVTFLALSMPRLSTGLSLILQTYSNAEIPFTVRTKNGKQKASDTMTAW